MIRPPVAIPQLTIGRQTGTVVQDLKLGQIVRAQVLEGTPPDQGGGRALLLIGRSALGVRAQTPLRTGSTLTLQVSDLGRHIGLRVVEQTVKQPPIERTAPLLRQLIPQQTAGSPLYGTVTASPPPRAAPSELQSAWAGLRQAVPDTSKLTHARGLREAVRDSGVFLESKLARGPSQADLQVDLKAALLRLLAALARSPAGATTARPGHSVPAALSQPPPPPVKGSLPVPQPRAPIPPEISNPALQLNALRQMIEGSLARLNLHQVASSSTGQPEGAQSWLLEVPVRHGDAVDILHLRIREEERRGDRDSAADRVWSVEVALDLPGLGPVRARVKLLGESVSTAFWAEDESTADRIGRELPRLRSALEAHRLEVASMSARSDVPDTAVDATDGGGLLETRA